jgi:hypothetical protein
VIATHHLEPMEQEELADYIQHRLSMVGWDNDPCFTSDAVEAIYAHSAGVPRRLNTLCSRVLLYGALEEIHTIDADVIGSVVSDMASDTRAVPTPTSSARSTPQPLNRQNDATIPLEAEKIQKENKEMEGRLDQLEGMMKSQDQTLQQLTQLMTQLAGGMANKDKDE